MTQIASRPNSIVAIKSLNALLRAFGNEGAPELARPIRWYVLIDVAAFATKAEAQTRLNAYIGDAGLALNLYGDMDGLELKAKGPQLAALVEGTAALDQISLSPKVFEESPSLALTHR